MKKQRIRLPNKQGLVAEFLLSGNTNDTSGNGYNANPVNITYSKTDRGYQSYSGSFNGSNAYATTASNFPNLGTTFTISFWFKTTTTTTNTAFFGGWQIGGDNFMVNINASSNNGALRFLLTDSSSSPNQLANEYGSGYNDGKWHHCVVNTNGSFQEVWADNVRIGTSNFAHTAIDTSTLLGIGGVYYSNGSFGNYFPGQLQGIRFFNRVLSADEIRDWYLEGLRALGGSSLSGLMDGLVAYYDFRGDANDIISGYDGTVNGATLTTDRFGTANSAYYFNGSSYVNIPNNSVCNALNNFTRHVVCTIPNTTSYGKVYSNAYAHLLMNNTLIQVYHYIGADYVLNYYHSIPAGTTVYCTWVKSSTEGIKLYVNGELVASNPSGTGDTYSRSNLGIGGDNTYGEYYTGRIDSVELYNRIFSASEVKALYELSKQSKLLPFA